MLGFSLRSPPSWPYWSDRSPEFAQQYAQRLGGAIEELQRIVDHFDDYSRRSGYDRQGALGLSDRERSVLELMASGSTNPEIAATLHLSKHTVKEHTSAVYRKLGVRNRTEAVQRGQRLGLLA